MAGAQVENPVYVDDSPRARDTLRQIPLIVASGNWSEAVRALQVLLDEESDRLLALADDPDLFVGVRRQVHQVLLDSPDLLDRYREAQGHEALRLLEHGEIERVERSFLLTPAGYEAALRLAQQHLEAARFEAAALTLEQLENHPDRHASTDAATMLGNVARYIDRQPLRERTARWAVEAGLAVPRFGAIERPGLSTVVSISPYAGGEAVELDGMLRSPLHSVNMMPDDVYSQYFRRPRTASGRSRQGEPAQPWIFPTVVGDTVFINDGFTISAWDRFTLSPKWRVEPPVPTQAQIEDQRRFGATNNFASGAIDRIEDTSSVTVAGPIVVATTGIAAANGRDGDGRVHAFDAQTGRRLWSVAVAGLDPRLEFASVRGPALIEGDTVIVSARKYIQTRRLNSVYLIGLDLGTGRLRWVRLLGSVGSLPSGINVHPSPAAILEDGVVYRTDTLGVAAAIEATTGRPRWIRRIPTAATRNISPTHAWANAMPIIVGPDLFILSPNKLEVLRLERESGRITGRISSNMISRPRYLIRVGPYLAAIGASAVSFIPLKDFGNGRIRDTENMHATPLIGRAFASGDRLVVPREDGVMVFDPEAPRDPVFLELDHYGNMIGLESQLLVADDRRLHSYLVWEVASELLRDRIESNEHDPSPAITFAELAFLADRDDEILDAVEHAIDVIESDPLSDTSIAARRRLVDALAEMVIASQRRWTGDTPANDRPAIESLALLGRTIDRLGRIVHTSNDQVFYLLARGRHQAAEGDTGAAIESYQLVLGDVALASADWTGAGVTVRAELEASRRLTDLLEEYGPVPYYPFDTEAARAVELLGPAPPPIELETLGRRYPVSAQGPKIWALAADGYDRINRPHASIRARRTALESARFGITIGRAVSDAELGELIGRLVDALADADRVGEAAELLDRTRTGHPGLALTANGEPIEADSLATRLAEQLALSRVLPRIGPSIGPDVQRLEGWVYMRPMTDSSVGSNTTGAMFVSTGSRLVGFFSAGGDDPTLTQRWSASFEGQRPPKLVRIDAEAAYIFELIGEQGRLVRLDLQTGRRDWVSPVFDELFGSRFKERDRLFDSLGPIEVETPLDGRVRLVDLLVVADGQTVVLVERSGRSAALDLATGRLLWSAVTPIAVVHDIHTGWGVLAIGGVHEERLEPDGEIIGFNPIAAAFDIRTGDLMQRLDRLDGSVRWVRVAAGPDLLLGLDQSVVSVSLLRGHINWTINDEQVHLSRIAWLFGNRFFLLGQSGQLWFGTLDSGRLSEKPLKTDRRLSTQTPVRVTRFEDRIAFMSARGVVMFDKDGQRVGVDALDGFEAFVPPAPGQPYFVTIHNVGQRHGFDETMYSLYMLSSRSAKHAASPINVLLESAPVDLTLLDGRVLIVAGGSTAVLRAPAD